MLIVRVLEGISTQRVTLSLHVKLVVVITTSIWQSWQHVQTALTESARTNILTVFQGDLQIQDSSNPVALALDPRLAAEYSYRRKTCHQHM